MIQCDILFHQEFPSEIQCELLPYWILHLIVDNNIHLLAEHTVNLDIEVSAHARVGDILGPLGPLEQSLPVHK